MTPEGKVRNPCLRLAARLGLTDPDTPHARRKGVHKRMHFGDGTANGWPDDLFLFQDGHHWWVEFKREGGEATPKQKFIHDKIRGLLGDVSVIDNETQFEAELHERLAAHTAY